MGDNEVTVFGQNCEGIRCAQVVVNGMRVLVTPDCRENNQAAVDLARIIMDSKRALDSMREQLVRERRDCSVLESQLNAVLTGKRRLFGQVLLVAGNDGWSGEVWLQDPEKRERGMALRFSSLAECRQEHPELWPVAVMGDGILMDSVSAAREIP